MDAQSGWPESWSAFSRGITEGGGQLLSRAQSAVNEIQKDAQYRQFLGLDATEKTEDGTEEKSEMFFNGVHNLKKHWKRVAPEIKKLGTRVSEATTELTTAGMRVLHETARQEKTTYLPWNNVQELFGAAIKISGHEPSFIAAELERRALHLSQSPDLLFALDAPEGFHLQERHWLCAKELIGVDPALRRLRFDVVPRKMPEEIFWKQYMWRLEAEVAQLEVEILSGQLPMPAPPPPPSTSHIDVLVSDLRDEEPSPFNDFHSAGDDDELAKFEAELLHDA
ncbi:MAG: hypothetical protein KVP17_000295 [Porospora cf. gigantea B]|uniref:uncharacterized protein n=1 Tax=Porospora cf. gigantea B TaxID=2853592 RepID=UPI00357197EC|nr:MAG: hypothetical protein KVP17_000295 [Porospora cf. gigantea B]